MDINIIKENLEKEYQCQFIAIMNYAGHHFAKTFMTEQEKVSYRYFKVLENNTVEEVTNELLLAYLKEMNEIHEEINY